MDKLKAHWRHVAGGWGAWREWTEKNFAPLTDWLRSAARWEPGIDVLDVGCGAGYPALAAAASVRPGHVVGVDISNEMLVEAAKAARRAGLENTRFVEMDGDDLQFEDRS